LGIILLLKGYKDHTWVKGYKGEKIVSKNLKNLPSGFFIFNDVNIPLGRGNFDHVVVGPTGIFLVETKNLRGFLKINGDEWYGFRGKSGFNPGIQAKSNAVQFSKFLQQNLSFGNIWVNAIVALINPNFEVIKRPKYYDVKYVSELSDFIAGVPRNMNHQTIVSVVEFIQDYSSEVIYQKDDIDYGEEIEEDFSEQVVPAKSSSDAQEFVLPILKTLPPEFRIFSNIELSPKEGSIDFVVLGPNGVFLVECHNFSATFQINDEEWRIIRNFNGHLKYNPGMRAKQKAFRLSKFLNSKKLTKRRIWVNTVIALVNPDFKLIKQPEHCFVKSLDELSNFIADYKGNIDQKSINNIVNCLLHEMDGKKIK
jgi:hypothetical protein